jgi:hypothetical protein
MAANYQIKLDSAKSFFKPVLKTNRLSATGCIMQVTQTTDSNIDG